MLIGNTSQYYKKLTSANAKMEEYGIELSDRISLDKSIESVFLTAIGILGDIAANIQRKEKEYNTILDENREQLLFSAKFIEDYYNGDINSINENLYLIMASAAYYLAGNIGNSKVLVNKINIEMLDLDVNGLEYALVSLLKDKFEISEESKYRGKYESFLLDMKQRMNLFYNEYTLMENDINEKFRMFVYKSGTDLELLFADVFLTILNLKIKNSFIMLSNDYVNIESNDFKKELINNNKIKELWPSQKNIGENNVFKGKSAVIQLPTGSGKTKSLTILLSIYFLQSTKKIAVIVAPFRALCREISNDLKKDFGKNRSVKIDELNDILNEENIFILENDVKTVMILTPEKFMYILKKQKEIIDEIGLIVFDEGHIFDEWQRGVNYELLISNLKLLLNEDTQKVLISAVGNNLEKINEWLNSGSGVTIKNNLLKTTEKSLCFVNWRNNSGYLNFLNNEDLNEEFYVPRFIKKSVLKSKGREKNIRYFPALDFKNLKDEYNDVAIYCGIKLCIKGATILFCGNKKTAFKILKRIIEINERGYDTNNDIKTADLKEIEKLSYIVSKNYGENNEYYLGAKLGIFVHHADISNGIKLSIEYALKNKLISFLICTSTLAQGVNLPIKYLIMTTIYQGGNKINAKDFNNLIGRAGRPGMYTEGTIIFSDPYVYMYKDYSRKQEYKWNIYKDLILNNESDSNDISMFIKIIDENIFSLVEQYYNDNFEEAVENYLANFEEQQKIKEQNKIYDVLKILSQIENFVMSYLTEEELQNNIDNIEKIAKETLGYYLAEDEQKAIIVKLFTMIANYCFNNVTIAEKRYLYSENVFGVKDNQIIDDFILKNLDIIITVETSKELLRVLNPLITDILKEKNDLNICNMWIDGNSYKEISEKNDEIKDINKCLKICNKKISYEMPLIVSAVQDNLKYKVDDDGLMNIFNLLVKELKYGIKTNIGIKIYELGFSDREVVKEIENYLENEVDKEIDVFNVKDVIKEEKNNILRVLDKYPTAFKYQLEIL